MTTRDIGIVLHEELDRREKLVAQLTEECKGLRVAIDILERPTPEQHNRVSRVVGKRRGRPPGSHNASHNTGVIEDASPESALRQVWRERLREQASGQYSSAEMRRHSAHTRRAEAAFNGALEAGRESARSAYIHPYPPPNLRGTSPIAFNVIGAARSFRTPGLWGFTQRACILATPA
jgi:hypothetical protein